MSNKNTIPKLPPSRDTLNYETLIQKGRDYIEKIASKIWTDYNIHDPGTTTLELLCYAITDLAYRIELPIEDLLADTNLKHGGLDGHFHSAKHILPTCPVNESDYRKLFIDIEGVNNAWITLSKKRLWINCEERYGENEDNYGVISYDDPGILRSKQFDVKGYYTVLLELDEAIKEQADVDAIIEIATKKYHAHRNLCEDLAEIKIVPRQKIAFCTSIELQADANPEATWARVVFELENYLHPFVRFHSLEQMLELKDENDNSLSVDDIFVGPVLDHGFIPETELEKSKLRKEVRASDIIRIIMDIEGVKKIDDILIDFCGEENVTEGGKWLLCIKDGHLPVLCPDKMIINFNKRELPIVLDKSMKEQKLMELRQQQKEENKAYSYDDLPMPVGHYHDIADYHPVQNDFPNTYGINQNGLPSTASTERKALASQFKGYVTIFDQMIALYMQHLSQVRTLFAADDAIKKTYFSQPVSGIKDIEKLFDNYGNLGTNVAAIVAGLDDYPLRKNRFLDHLIARFAERFSDFVFVLRDLYSENIEDEIINYKVQFLRDYPVLSRSRFAAINYLFPEDGNCSFSNMAGLQNRIMRLSGMLPAYEIYQELDEDGIDEYRWRIRDKSGKIILSASTRYYTQADAIEEMRVAVSLAWNEANYDMKVADDGTYYFNIVSPGGEIVVGGEVIPPGEVVGRRIQYFKSQEEAETAVAHVVKSLEEKHMYLFEHLLMLPDPAEAHGYEHFMPVCLDKNCDGCDPVDPYSFRITIAMPGWTERFENIDFRNFVEKTIRMECPAHILPRICWISKEQMPALNIAYEAWRTNKKSGSDPAALNTALKNLLEILLNLHTIYPEGMLYDCKDPVQDENPVILNRTNLGNL